MQSPTAPSHEPTPLRSPLDSPITVTSSSSSGSEASDTLIVELSQGVADVINKFKRRLDQRDGDWANVHGQIEIALDLQDYVLTVEPDELGDEYPIKVTAKIKKDEATNGIGPSIPAHNSSRRGSEGHLESSLESRQKRRADKDGDASPKRRRTGDDFEDAIPLITKEDLNQLLLKLRDDTQEDTAECVEHVQSLLQRFDREPHRPTGIDQHQSQHRPSVDNSMSNSSATAPSPGLDRDTTATTSLGEVFRREARLLSSQIKWVEDCRRLASDSHDQREETWRTSSAGFHDRARQNREDFQNTILHHQRAQGQTLQQILNEVRAIGLYAQSCKWEVPGETPGRGMALTHHATSVPFNVGAGPSQGQHMHSFLLATSDGRGKASGSTSGRGRGALPPFPR